MAVEPIQVLAGEDLLPGRVVMLGRVETDMDPDTPGTQIYKTQFALALLATNNDYALAVTRMFSRRPQDFSKAEFAAIKGEPAPLCVAGQVAEVLVDPGSSTDVKAGKALGVSDSPTNKGTVITYDATKHKTIVGFALHDARPGNFVRVYLTFDQVA